nr:uncharacterized protein LOC103351904 isoform X7 [Oryctolagus cuniculus]
MGPPWTDGGASCLSFWRAASARGDRFSCLPHPMRTPVPAGTPTLCRGERPAAALTAHPREKTGDFPSQHLIQLEDTGAGLGGKLDIVGAARSAHQPIQEREDGQTSQVSMSSRSRHRRRPRKSLFMPWQQQRSCGVSSPQEGDSAEEESVHTVTSAEALRCQQPHGAIVHSAWWKRLLNEVGLQVKVSLSQREDSRDFPNQHFIPLKDTEAGLVQGRHSLCSFQREDSGDFPNRHLISLRDTEAGLGDLISMAAIPGGPSPRRSTDAGQRGTAVISVTAHPGEKTVETSQTGISSHSNSISTHRSWPGPFQREDSGDFPNDLISMAAIPGGPSPRRSTDAGQRGTAVISVTGDLISMAAIPGGPSPRRSTDAGQPGTALISVTAHPGEKTVEISQTGISSHSNSISTHRSWPGPSQREDSGGFPNRHLILPKDTGAGLAHPRERIVEASQTGISSCPKTQELAWPILEKRQWRLPKLASHPTQTPSQPTGAALGDLISMAAIPGGPSHRRSTDAGQRGTAVISVTGDLISMAAIPGGPSPYRSTDAGQRGTAVISVTGDLISMSAIPGGPSPRRNTDAGQRGTAVISVTGDLISMAAIPGGPSPRRSTDAGQRGTALISVTGDLISMAAIPGGPRPRRSTDAGQLGTALISVTGDLISMAAIPGGPRPRRSTDAGQPGTAVISVTGRVSSCRDSSRGPAVSAALRKETVLRWHHPSGMSAKARSKVHSPRTQPFLGNHNTPKDQVWRYRGPSTWAILHCLPGPQQRTGLEEEQLGLEPRRPYGMLAPQTED